MSTLAAALAKAQSEFPAIPKDSVNPHFKNRFASLHAIMEKVLPVLNQNGLALMQFPTTLDGAPALRTKLVHGETGEHEEDTMLLLHAKADPQGQGSALSYARRYAVLSILGLVADEDDDGQAASRPSKQASRPSSPPAKGAAARTPAAAPPSPAATPPANAESKPDQDQLVTVDELVTEVAALRKVDRAKVLQALTESLGEGWQSSETATVMAAGRLRAWRERAMEAAA